MIEQRLVLRSRSPLALRAERSRTQFTPGLDYIPGSTLRGAVATVYLQEHAADADFERLFVSDEVQWPDMIPTERDEPSFLMPTTAQLCKYSRWDHALSLSDSLLRLALVDCTGDLSPIRDEGWARCPEDCSGNLDRISGYLSLINEPVRPYRRMLTGTSINRTTGTVQMGMLFSQQVLEEHQFFAGGVRILSEDNAAYDIFQQLQDLLAPGTLIRVGAARSRGLGLAEVEEWDDEPWSPPALNARYEIFNDAFAALWHKYHDSSSAPPCRCFSLTLDSHLILHDAGELPILSLEGRMDLDTLLGLPGVVLKRHVIPPALVRGWDGRRGLRKNDEPALGRSGALFFAVCTDDEDVLLKRLAEIEAHGLGERRNEGFGRVRVCDPFHYTWALKEMRGQP